MDFVLYSTLVRPCTAYYVISVRRFGSLPAKVPHLDIRLPSDSTSRWTPLPSANASYCRARSGLSPPSCYPCRAHNMKGSPELGGPFVSYGVWLRQMDLIRGPARYGVALVHYGLLSVGSPHSSASQPPSPQGKALGGTMYHKKVQYFKFVPRCQSLPRGGRWPG